MRPARSSRFSDGSLGHLNPRPTQDRKESGQAIQFQNPPIGYRPRDFFQKYRSGLPLTLNLYPAHALTAITGKQ